MSSQNGDKARFNRLRKQKLRRRELMARSATQSAASAARLDKTPVAKVGAAVAAEHAPSPTPSMDSGSCGRSKSSVLLFTF
jgi:hypothetical protein